MRVAGWIGWLATVAVASASATEVDYEHKFAQWMALYATRFGNALEYARRLETFIENDRFIEAHNTRGDASFELGHNAYSHLTFDEFTAAKKGFRMPPEYLARREAAARNASASSDVQRRPVEVGSVPDSVDWVAKGGVTPVKNQGQCGSCWAFSTTGAVEGAAFVASGKLVSLSEQELVDCDHDGDQGCNGGLMDHAFHWIKTHRGICSESAYEYHAAVEECRKCDPVVKVSGFTDVEANDEGALQVAVAQQPVAVAIEADQREFQFYKSGVFNLECGTQLDHGVLVVGYGADQKSGQKFWKVKNSWGATWGEAGYIRLSREMGRASGQCGVAMAPSYPIAAVVEEVPSSETASGPEEELARYELAIQELEEQLLTAEPVEVPCPDGLTMMEEKSEALGVKSSVYEYFEESN